MDEEIVHAVLDLLAYQQRIRELYKPIIADNPAAVMEQKIVSKLREGGPLTERELRQFVNADRAGVKVFKDALKSLRDVGRVRDEATTGITSKGSKTKFYRCVLVEDRETVTAS